MTTYIGKTFGLLTVLGIAEVRRYGGGSDNRKVILDCRCECGARVRRSKGALRKAAMPACAACRKKRHAETSAQHHKHPLYACYAGMIHRCHGTGNSQAHKYYRDRGVEVCAQWRGPGGFRAFVRDMGERPPGVFSVDRIDPSGDYEPGNCRWATARTQASNRSSAVRATYCGVTKPLGEWAEMFGVASTRFARPLSLGVPPDEIVRRFAEEFTGGNMRWVPGPCKDPSYEEARQGGALREIHILLGIDHSDA